MLTATAALTVVTAIGAALVIFASPNVSAPTVAIGVPPEFGSSRAPAAITILGVPPPPAFVSPSTPGGVWIDRDGRRVLSVEVDGRRVLSAEVHGPAVEINKVGATLLIVGIVGIVPALLLLFWSSRFDNLRSRPTY